MKSRCIELRSAKPTFRPSVLVVVPDKRSFSCRCQTSACIETWRPAHTSSTSDIAAVTTAAQHVLMQQRLALIMERDSRGLQS